MSTHLWLDAEGNIDWDASAFEAQEYQRRWEEMKYWVAVEFAAECHTFDVLMGCETPPVARVVRNPGQGWVHDDKYGWTLDA